MELSSSLAKIAPHLSLLFTSFTTASYIFLSKVIVVQGINATVFITYQYLSAAFALALLAFIFERKRMPSLTWKIILEIFFLALLGMTIGQIMSTTALYYVPSTIESASLNLCPAVTYIICVIIRQEKLQLQTVWGSGKVLGTLISVSGAFCLFFWHGSGSDIGTTDSSNWTIGLLLLASAVFCTSAWMIMLSGIARRFPAEMSLTAMMSFFATIQTGVVAALMNPQASQWQLKWDLELLNIVLGGLIANGFAIFIGTWCAKVKGPVFALSFSPLAILLNAIFELLFYGRRMNVGSIFGSILIVFGLYMYLWSKSKEEDVENIMNADSETTTTLLG